MKNNTNWEQLLKENKILNGTQGFDDKYRCFSNFYKHDAISIKLPYGHKNSKYYFSDNVETLFQAAKCKTHKDIQSIILTTTPGEAKRLGRKVELREDWENIKEEVMKELINKKLEVLPYFKKILMEIPEHIVIAEFNTWNDAEWGVSSKTLKGNNKLGEILMNLRIKLKTEKYYNSLKFIFNYEIENIILDYSDEIKEILDKLTKENIDKLFEIYYDEEDPLEFNILDNKKMIDFLKKYIGEI